MFQVKVTGRDYLLQYLYQQSATSYNFPTDSEQILQN